MFTDILRSRRTDQPVAEIVPNTQPLSLNYVSLEALTGCDAKIRLTLQAKWDLWHASRARGPRPKIRPLRKTA